MVLYFLDKQYFYIIQSYVFFFFFLLCFFDCIFLLYFFTVFFLTVLNVICEKYPIFYFFVNACVEVRLSHHINLKIKLQIKKTHVNETFITKIEENWTINSIQKFIGSECFRSFPTVGSGQILDSDSSFWEFINTRFLYLNRLHLQLFTDSFVIMFIFDSWFLFR